MPKTKKSDNNEAKQIEMTIYNASIDMLREALTQYKQAKQYEDIPENMREVLDMLFKNSMIAAVSSVATISHLMRLAITDRQSKQKELREKILLTLYETYKESGILTKTDNGIAVNANPTELLPILDEIIAVLSTIQFDMIVTLEELNYMRAQKFVDMYGDTLQHVLTLYKSSRDIDKMYR